MAKSKRLRPPKPGQPYGQLWRIVDGAIRDAFNMHPEYLGDVRLRAVRESLTKRVTGAVKGYAEQTALRGVDPVKSGGFKG